ncbi:MAG: glycogen debranching enzyme N-terminal domain-containing protein, partial [Salinibacter sp.]
MLEFARNICSDLESAQAREWLVTNGIGGYAMGTVGGPRTRAYHGLLVAALDPPLGRTLLVSHVDET